MIVQKNARISSPVDPKKSEKNIQNVFSRHQEIFSFLNFDLNQSFFGGFFELMYYLIIMHPGIQSSIRTNWLCRNKEMIATLPYKCKFVGCQLNDYKVGKEP